MSIPLLDNAVPADYHFIFDIFEISAAGIAVIILLFLGALLSSKLQRGEVEADREVVYLFYASLLIAVLYTISEITASSISMSDDSDLAVGITWSIAVVFYGSFLYILLLTLVVRLYLNFKDSVMRMSTRTVNAFAVLFAVLLLLWILEAVSVVAVVGFDYNALRVTLIVSGSLFLGLYVVECVLAVRVFATNLSATSSQGDLSVDSKESQQKLLILSAKYVALFCVAILSTILNAFFYFIVSFECGGLFGAIDICLKMQCLYWQFAFAQEQYQQYCGCLDSCCRAVVLKRVNRAESAGTVSEVDRGVSAYGTIQ